MPVLFRGTLDGPECPSSNDKPKDGDNGMSLFIAGTIAGASVLAGLLVVVSEQIRVAARRLRGSARDERCSAITTPGAGRSREDRAVAPTPLPSANRQPVSPVSADARAAAYQEILDALGDDLDDDIAEWEAVLEDFPQVIGASGLHKIDNRRAEPVVEAADEPSVVPPRSTPEPITPPQRTRRISADENGLIQRLLRSDFAAEEIALCLNLPLERVQEVQLRNGLT